MVEFEKVLATAVAQKKILIVEGKVDFDTADADVIDCAKWKVLDIRRYTVFKNAEYLSKVDLAVIRQNWEDTDYRYINNWSFADIGEKLSVDRHTAMRWHDKALAKFEIPENPTIIEERL